MNFEEFSTIVQREYRELFIVGTLEIKRIESIKPDSYFIQLTSIYAGKVMWRINCNSKLGVLNFENVMENLSIPFLVLITNFMKELEQFIKEGKLTKVFRRVF